MHLNAMAVEDLDETLLDDDLIQQPDVSVGEKTKLTMIVPLDKTSDRQEDARSDLMFGAHIEPGELPNIDAQFVLLTDEHSKVVDLTDIESAIIDGGNICQESARHVNDVIGGLFTDKLHMTEFTTLPSKVNLNYTKAHMRKRVGIEEASFVNSYQTFIQSSLAAVNSCKDTQQQVTENLCNAVEEVVDSYGELLFNNEPFKNVIFSCGDNFVNILSMPLVAGKVEDAYLIANSNSSVPVNVLENYIGGLKAMLPLLENPCVNNFINTAIAGKDTSGTVLADLPILFSNMTELTVNDLIQFYKSSELESNIKALCATLMNCITEYENISATVAADNGNFNEVSSSFVKEGSAIHESLNKILRIKSLFTDLSLLTAAVCPVFALVVEVESN